MKELQTTFIGRGEVKGFLFRQIERTERAYIYEVSHPDVKKPHYEVFRRRENDRFGAVSYPKANAFGIWAWTYFTLAEAREKLAEITHPQNMLDLHPVTAVLASSI